MSEVHSTTTPPLTPTKMTSHEHTSPQLLKQLTSPPVVSSVAANLAALVAAAATTTTDTSSIQNFCASGRMSPTESPARKKLKLDIEAASNAQQVQLTKEERRRRLFERRSSKLNKVRKSFKDNMAEVYFLQSDANVFDLPGFRRKPTYHYLNFLVENEAPRKVIEEVREQIVGKAVHFSALSEPSSPATTPRSVTSAAMAAAVTALAAASGSPLTNQLNKIQQPYSPTASQISPVRFGPHLHQLTNFEPPKSSAPSSAFREQLAEKMKQEAWVLRRVSELTRDGLWSDQRLPKVCERPKPRTHWDVLLQEMRWLAVDFYQERQWKKAAAKMLAESARDYVAKLEERRRKKREAKERRLKQIARFAANQVLSFWDEAATDAVKSSVDTLLLREGESTSGHLCNNHNHIQETHPEENPSVSKIDLLQQQPNNPITELNIKQDRLLNHLSKFDFVEEEKDFSFEVLSEAEDSDDESTIAEQENYELQHTLVDNRHELDTLQSDSAKPLENLLRSEYPGYVPVSDSLMDASSDMSSSDDEEEDFCLEDVESIVSLPMFPHQRKLYDDYLAGPEARNALEKGDSLSISNVVRSLRKICNHPCLVEERILDEVTRCFVRIPVLNEVSKLVLAATDYDPLNSVDLGSLNLIFLQHETTLTAITSDWIRKYYAPRTLIEELPDRPAPAPTVPRGRLTIDIHSSSGSTHNSRPQLVSAANGQHLFFTSTPVTDRTEAVIHQEPEAEAFHQDSLRVIAKFNERRCMGMPLYGQDLLDALTVVDVAKPLSRNSRTRNQGQGYVNCLTAACESWAEFGSHLSSNSRVLRLPWNSTSLGASGKSRLHEKRIDFRYKTFALKQLLTTVGHQIHTVKSVLECCCEIALVNTTSRTLRLLRNRLEPSLTLVREQQELLYRAGLCSQTSRLAILPPSRSPFHFNNLSIKVEKFDELLRQFRRRGERVLVFCQMPETFDLLRQILNQRFFSFVFIEQDTSLQEKAEKLQVFNENYKVLVLLVSSSTPVADLSLPDIENVIFFDANWNNNSEISYENGDKASLMVSPCLQWCRLLRRQSKDLKIIRLVCEGTVEDTISIKALQERILCDIKIKQGPENGSSVPMFTVKRQTLEALFAPQPGDNGIIPNETASWNDNDKAEYLFDDVEAMAHLDFLWSNQKLKDGDHRGKSLADLSRHLDDFEEKDDTSKPIQRYAVDWISNLLEEDPTILDEDLIDPMIFLDENEEKLEWENRFQSDLAEAKSDMELMESLPCITYSSEDASRSWHGQDGQPMPLWTPPTPSLVGETELVDHHLSFLYKTRLMEESELPPVFEKKVGTPPPLGTQSGLKRTASDAGFSKDSASEHKQKYRNREDHLTSGGGFAPRSLFERPQAALPKASKMRNRMPNRHLPPGLAATVPAPGSSLPGGINPVAGLRHPLPRPQVEAENAPEWLVQEDWALLQAVRELQELPLSLLSNSPGHTPNWDLVSDMVNAVSRCYRGPRQCRTRYETIILPREEGRIYDMPPVLAAQTIAAQSAINKKSKKKQSGATKGGGNNRLLKTSTLFSQDNNQAWSSMLSTRFESIKSVANKRSPTTKPLVVNPGMKNSQHAAILSESGISYEAPLNPIKVAANRAERIQRDKLRQQQDQQQQLAQQRTAAAQAAAAQVAATAAQQQARLITAAIPQQSIGAAVQQSQQTVVATSQHPTAVVVSISQPMTTVTSAAINNVIQQQQLRSTPQQTIGIQEFVRVSSQQPQPSAVVVSSQPASSVVSVASHAQGHQQLAQKIVTQTGAIKGSVVQSRTLTPQQVNLLRQQSFLRQKSAQETVKARIQQGLPVAGTATPVSVVSTATTTVAGVASSSTATSTVVTPQKVTVAGVSLAPSNLVTVVTQAQPKTHLIRQVTTGPGGKATTSIRTMTEADMKLLLASKPQQLQTINAKGQVTQLQVPAQSNLAAQLLAGGIHVQQHTGAGGAQVATLVKTVSTSGGGNVAVVGTSGQVQQSGATIPVANVNLTQVKAAMARSGVTNPGQMQLLRQQFIQQQRKPVTTLTGATPHKVTLGQVGAKGVPAQLIVSSSGAGPKQISQQAVTMQQLQQIVKSVQPGTSGAQQTQQMIPHAVLAKQAVVSTTFPGGGTVAGLITTGGTTTSQTSTVQARVIPVSSTNSAGRVHVVAATPSQIQVGGTGARQITAAPNVTVDASGRPTGTYVSAAGTPHIRVATSGNQQFLSTSGQNVSVVRGPVGVLAAQQQVGTSQQVTKLQVVGPSTTTSSQSDRS